MNYFLISIAVIAFALLGCVIYLFLGTWKELARQAQEHAKYYALAYVKAFALIAIATGACFTETFSNLTADAAAKLSWWSWLILAWKPIAAGLATMCAFLDRSAVTATAKKEADESQHPFQQKPPPTP